MIKGTIQRSNAVAAKANFLAPHWTESDSENLHTLASQYTRPGQRGYKVFTLIKARYEATKERRLEFLRSGGKAELPPIPTQEFLAADIGINPETLRQVSHLHGIFDTHPALKAELEPQILRPIRPLSIGRALQIARERTAQSPKGPQP